MVTRNGNQHAWAEHAKHLYRTIGDQTVIDQAWLGGTLTVRAGKQTFTGNVSKDGIATFKAD